jgi:hypothetical protein
VSIVSSTGWSLRTLDPDLAQQVGEQQTARAQSLFLYLRILLHVVEEMPECGLDPEVHRALVGDDAVLLLERGLSLTVDRRPVVGQHLRCQLEGTRLRGDRHAQVLVAERDRHEARNRLHDADRR